MKKNSAVSSLKYLSILLLFLIFFVSCKNNQIQFGDPEKALVKDSVSRTVSNIEHDISTNGPGAWLNYFEDAPGFFMASGGQLAFKDYPSARSFILNTLIKSIPKIKLQWSNIRIDPIGPELATIGADFHEDLTDASGKTMPFDGYFTGTAHFNGHNWKLRNLHWSIKAPVK